MSLLDANVCIHITGAQDTQAQSRERYIVRRDVCFLHQVMYTSLIRLQDRCIRNANVVSRRGSAYVSTYCYP